MRDWDRGVRKRVRLEPGGSSHCPADTSSSSRPPCSPPRQVAEPWSPQHTERVPLLTLASLDVPPVCSPASPLDCEPLWAGNVSRAALCHIY